MCVLNLRLYCCFYNSVSGHQVRNRWLVAYTLIQNPSLVPLTATNLQTTTTDLKEEATSAHSGSHFPQTSYNQPSSSKPSLLECESSPPAMYQSSIGNGCRIKAEDFGDVTGHNTRIQSEATHSLVIISDSAESEPISESIEHHVVSEHNCELETAEVDSSRLPATNVELRVAKMKPEPSRSSVALEPLEPAQLEVKQLKAEIADIESDTKSETEIESIECEPGIKHAKADPKPNTEGESHPDFKSEPNVKSWIESEFEAGVERVKTDPELDSEAEIHPPDFESESGTVTSFEPKSHFSQTEA